MTKILILGAHGQIARVATQLLLERTDAELTLYLRKSKRFSALEGNDRVKLIEGDVLDIAVLDAAMAGQEVVYANLSGDMEKQARAIVAAMNRAGVRRLIFISSMGIYDEVPGERHGAILDPYRRSAAAIEASDLDYTLIRPAWLSDDEEIAYGTTAKGENFANAGATVSRKSVADLIVKLIIVISIKYAILIMRADNHGEGGILALLALVSPRRAKQNSLRAAVVVVGLVGATLLYGDGCITPAISVLSAVEGLKVYAPQLGHAVLPLTVAILLGLFMIQRRGTGFIGGLFGPIMLVWFIVTGVLGVIGILRAPGVLVALNPLAALTYLWSAGPTAFVVIGGAFLAVTGGEAFYADMGHFGPLPIRIAWFGVALPCLTLNYFGQGGLLLTQPDAADSPFYLLAPEWTHYPLLLLATVATVIASQAIISGAYSMTQQAINLGFLPRMKVIHTEGREIGQIYVPFVNWALAAATLAATIGFGSSDRLAGAFGIAVSLLMAITTLMATFVALHWKHNPFLVFTVNGSLLALDLLFFASTSTKLLDGGWFPLLVAVVISFLMLTWRKGEALMDKVRLEIRERSQDFIERLHRDPPIRIPGTAVVLGRMTKGVPLALSHNVKCNHVLNENVLLVAVTTTETPTVADEQRIQVTPLSEGLTRAELHFGFMEQPNVPEGLAQAMAHGKIQKFDLGKTIYYTGHETIIPSGRKPDLPRWREILFALMHHNAQRPGAFFKIPGSQILEIGVEFEI